MAIDELTKKEVLVRRSQLESRYRKNLAEIEALRIRGLALVEENIRLKAAYDALKKDIPDPTPPPVGP